MNAPTAHEEGLRFLKQGDSARAVECLKRAVELAPDDAEVVHDLGLAYLDGAQVGLAADAQRRALRLDPNHIGARAQLAASLEALGDDEGAAQALEELLTRVGPSLALNARLRQLRDTVQVVRKRRLVGAALQAVQASPLVGTALVPRPDGVWRATFAELSATVQGGVVQRLDFVFDSMDSSLARSDLSYGGTTEDEHGRRVPLDEFTSAGIVFLSEALGIDTVRARRILGFLLTPECGLGPHRIAGCNVGWTIHGHNGSRHYGLYASLGAAMPRES